MHHSDSATVTTVDTLAKLLDVCGELRASEQVDERAVTGCSFDSRVVSAGDVFFCKGAAFKPAFLSMALDAGAVAFVCEESLVESLEPLAKESGAASVTCWGDGSPLREFLYVDDLANLCVFLMNNYSGNETVNAGTGKELTIKELTELVAKVVGYNGEIKWDPDKPNGTPRKLLDVSKATNLGWTYKTELEDGIRLAYEDFLNNPMRAER